VELEQRYQETKAQLDTAKSALGGESVPVGMTVPELDNLNVSDNLAQLAALSTEELLTMAREGIKADIEGMVVAVESMTGQTAGVGMNLLTIASLKDVTVQIEASPNDFEQLIEGNTVNVMVGQHPYSGTLTRVNRIATLNATNNPVIKAEVTLDHPDENLAFGVSARVNMVVAQADGVMLIPLEAVNGSADGDFVYVITDGIVEQRPIELGIQSNTMVEVLSGLREGEQVVNDLNFDVMPGMQATPVVRDSEEQHE